MALLMKALRSFRGRPGEGSGPNDMVDAGSEFRTDNEYRAAELERGGLATPCPEVDRTESVHTDNGHADNKAAASGPLASHGGEIGVAPPLPLSDQVRQPRKPRSPRSVGTSTS